MWESAEQPAARWHSQGDGPVTYLADTADGAWAEFLRHEGITLEEDLLGVARRIWAIEVPEAISDQAVSAKLPSKVMRGSLISYEQCQKYAREIRRSGAKAVIAPSAALHTGGARGEYVNKGLHEASDRDGLVLAMFGSSWIGLRGWATGDVAAPTRRTLSLVAHL